jgi:hypothetical protein
VLLDEVLCLFEKSKNARSLASFREFLINRENRIALLSLIVTPEMN